MSRTADNTRIPYSALALPEDVKRSLKDIEVKSAIANGRDPSNIDGTLSKAEFDAYLTTQAGQLSGQTWDDLLRIVGLQAELTSRRFGSAEGYLRRLDPEVRAKYQEEAQTGIALADMPNDLMAYMQNHYNKYTIDDEEGAPQISQHIIPDEISEEDALSIALNTGYFLDFESKSVIKLYGLTDQVHQATGQDHALIKLLHTEARLCHLIACIENAELGSKAKLFLSGFGSGVSSDEQTTLSDQIFKSFLTDYKNDDASTNNINSELLHLQPSQLRAQASSRFLGMLTTLSQLAEALDEWMDQEARSQISEQINDGTDAASGDSDIIGSLQSELEQLEENDPNAAFDLLLQWAQDLGLPDPSSIEGRIVYQQRQIAQLQLLAEAAPTESLRLYYQGMAKLQRGDSTGLEDLKNAIDETITPDAKGMPKELKAVAVSMLAEARTAFQNTQVMRQLSFKREFLAMRWSKQLAWANEQKDLFDSRSQLNKAAWSAREALGARHWDGVGGNIQDFFTAMKIQDALEELAESAIESGKTFDLQALIQQLIDNKTFTSAEIQKWRGTDEIDLQDITAQSDASAWLKAARALQGQNLHQEAVKAAMHAASKALFKLDSKLSPLQKQALQGHLDSMSRAARKKIETGHDERVQALVAQGIPLQEARAKVSDFENKQIEEILDIEYAAFLAELHHEGTLSYPDLTDEDQQALQLIYENKKGLFGFDPDAWDDFGWAAAEFVTLTVPSLLVGGFVGNMAQSMVRRGLIGLVGRELERQTVKKVLRETGTLSINRALRSQITKGAMPRATGAVETGYFGLVVNGVAFHASLCAFENLQVGEDAWDGFWQGSLLSVGMLGSIAMGNLFHSSVTRPILTRYMSDGARVTTQGARAQLALTNTGEWTNKSLEYFTETVVFAGYGQLQAAALDPASADPSSLGKDFIHHYGRSLLELGAIKSGGRLAQWRQDIRNSQSGGSEQNRRVFYMPRRELDQLGEKRGLPHGGEGYYDPLNKRFYIPEGPFHGQENRGLTEVPMVILSAEQMRRVPGAREGRDGFVDPDARVLVLEEGASRMTWAHEQGYVVFHGAPAAIQRAVRTAFSRSNAQDLTFFVNEGNRLAGTHDRTLTPPIVSELMAEYHRIQDVSPGLRTPEDRLIYEKIQPILDRCVAWQQYKIATRVLGTGDLAGDIADSRREIVFVDEAASRVLPASTNIPLSADVRVEVMHTDGELPISTRGVPQAMRSSSVPVNQGPRSSATGNPKTIVYTDEAARSLGLGKPATIKQKIIVKGFVDREFIEQQATRVGMELRSNGESSALALTLNGLLMQHGRVYVIRSGDYDRPMYGLSEAEYNAKRFPKPLLFVIEAPDAVKAKFPSDYDSIPPNVLQTIARLETPHGEKSLSGRNIHLTLQNRVRQWALSENPKERVYADNYMTAIDRVLTTHRRLGKIDHSYSSLNDVLSDADASLPTSWSKSMSPDALWLLILKGLRDVEFINTPKRFLTIRDPDGGQYIKVIDVEPDGSYNPAELYLVDPSQIVSVSEYKRSGPTLQLDAQQAPDTREGEPGIYVREFIRQKLTKNPELVSDLIFRIVDSLTPQEVKNVIEALTPKEGDWGDPTRREPDHERIRIDFGYDKSEPYPSGYVVHTLKTWIEGKNQVLAQMAERILSSLANARVATQKFEEVKRSSPFEGEVDLANKLRGVPETNEEQVRDFFERFRRYDRSQEGYVVFVNPHATGRFDKFSFLPLSEFYKRLLERPHLEVIGIFEPTSTPMTPSKADAKLTPPTPLSDLYFTQAQARINLATFSSILLTHLHSKDHLWKIRYSSDSSTLELYYDKRGGESHKIAVENLFEPGHRVTQWADFSPEIRQAILEAISKTFVEADYRYLHLSLAARIECEIDNRYSGAHRPDDYIGFVADWALIPAEIQQGALQLLDTQSGGASPSATKPLSQIWLEMVDSQNLN